MSAERTAARNRANARNSTGPRTAAGKARAAQNARRHGATGRPTPERVELWLRIILDRPGISLATLPSDARSLRALALAQAEVRLVEVARALEEVEASIALPEAADRLLVEAFDRIQKSTDDIWMPMPARCEAHRLMDRILAARTESRGPGGQRHRLLKRYWGEARAQRRRAFAAWIAGEAGEVV